MRGLLLGLIMLSLGCAPGAHSEPPAAEVLSSAAGTAENCVEDHAAFMAMDYWTFDQSPEGVRSVLWKPGCAVFAADLMRDYHAMLRARGQPVRHTFPEGEVTFSETGEMPILYWHEGQARAFEGETAEALVLFRLSIEPPERSFAGWNQYVRATIAFIENDLDVLKQEREALFRLTRPGYGDINLGVVDGLIACFGRSYSDAYSAAECNRRPARASH